jgi:hypothetical protein
MTTVIEKGRPYRILYTQNVLEITERLKYEIAGKKFYASAVPTITAQTKTARGYVVIDKQLRGPITLKIEDIERL